MKILTARTAMQTAIKAIPAFAALTPQLERNGDDITDAVDADLGKYGLSIVVMAPSGAVSSQTKSGSAVCLNAIVGVCVLENPNVNIATGGTNVTSEDVVELIVAALIGMEVNGGEITMLHEAWKRQPEQEGMVVNVVGFHVPVMIRRTG
jgi:hypothetical protein